MPEGSVDILLVESTFAAGVFAMGLAVWSARVASPLVGIVNRWCRWGFLALATAYLLRLWGVDDRPTWVLVATGGLGWLLVESLYVWLAISAFSQSTQPLFPQYQVNKAGDEWPATRRGIRLREEIRKAGFVHRGALRAELTPELVVRTSLFETADRLHRLQVLFIPQPSGSVAVCFSFSSQDDAGVRTVTDNLFTPFGGFYPEHYRLERCPLTRGFGSLWRRHASRAAAGGGVLQPWDTEVLADLNAQQRILEQLNTELGFLVPKPEREELGKLTSQGRYRIWKEIWLLHYFGTTMRYAE